MAYIRYKASCLSCKTEVSSNKLDTHYNSAICKDGGMKEKLINCPYCNKLLSGIDNGNHVRWCKYNLEHTHGKTISCSKCNIMFSLLSPKDRRKTCSDECAHKHSKEDITNISKARKKYLKENPDLHPWKKKDKNISTPCENVKAYLISNNINFIEEYSPLIDRFFSIDIAFPNLKIGIEINGNQHYNRDGTLQEYYQKRHDLIESDGWKLIEIHYSKCFSIDQIKTIFDFSINHNSNEEISRIKELLAKPSKSISLPRGEKAKLKYLTASNEKWLPIKNIIFDYDIDFTKFGWVHKVAKILEIPDQKVNKWMKRFHPEFLQTCFTRNTKQNS